MEKEKGQLTLFDCRKVVSGGRGGSWVCFDEGAIVAHKQTLLRPDSSMHLLLNTLRKLDCYRLQLSDISSTEIGRAVATVARHHPRPEVSRLATALLLKWQSEFDSHLFSELEYDADAAAAAPEGDPQEFQLAAPPPPPPAELPPEQPTRVQPARKDRAMRLQEESAFFEDSDFEGISDSSEGEGDDEGDDDDWRPDGGSRRRKSGASAGKASGVKQQKKAKH